MVVVILVSAATGMSRRVISTEMACPCHVCFPPDSDQSDGVLRFRLMVKRGPL
jgi:hypothetical protein